MAANYREYRVFPGPIEYYIEKMRAVAAAGLKFTPSGEQPIPNGLLFILRHGVSFTSWGETIKLALVSQGNQTVVDIDSECALGTQIVDWGKNRENVNQLFNYLARPDPQLQQRFSQPRQSAPGAVQPAGEGSVTCPNCGNVMSGSGAFCTACGMRLR